MFKNIWVKRVLIIVLLLLFCATGFIILANTYIENSKKVPIIMYHHLDNNLTSTYTISANQFEEHIKALSDSGYTSVSTQQIIDYVEKGIQLPHKPVVITFDDGYLSNYEIAYPILKKYNMKATIFIVGIYVGKDTYKNTNQKIIPHFNYEQANEMIDSGLIEIQSHTYDMHQRTDYENGPARTNVLPLEGEDENSYLDNLKTDIIKAKKDILSGTGKDVFAFAYPGGRYNDLSQKVLNEMNIKAIFTTKEEITILTKGQIQTLKDLKRFSIIGDISPKKLLEMIKE